jgi:hypothetical protein
MQNNRKEPLYLETSNSTLENGFLELKALLMMESYDRKRNFTLEFHKKLI